MRIPLWDMYSFCEADTERAVGLLRQYQANLTSPEEQALKTSVGKVSAILGSQLFQALLGKNLFWGRESFKTLTSSLHQTFLRVNFLHNFSCSRDLIFLLCLRNMSNVFSMAYIVWCVVWLGADRHRMWTGSGCINLYRQLTESKYFPIKSYERGLSVHLTKVCCMSLSVPYSDCNEISLKPNTTQSIYDGAVINSVLSHR